MSYILITHTEIDYAHEKLLRKAIKLSRWSDMDYTEVKTLVHHEKLEYFLDHIDDISLEQLEGLLSKK